MAPETHEGAPCGPGSWLPSGGARLLCLPPPCAAPCWGSAACTHPWLSLQGPRRSVCALLCAARCALSTWRETWALPAPLGNHLHWTLLSEGVHHGKWREGTMRHRRQCLRRVTVPTHTHDTRPLRGLRHLPSLDLSARFTPCLHFPPLKHQLPQCYREDEFNQSGWGRAPNRAWNSRHAREAAGAHSRHVPTRPPFLAFT